jgi:hypothetical protein
MSAHYNVDKTVRQFRRSLDATTVPKGAPRAAFIQHNNREIHANFLRLVLTERNNGSDEVEILAAIAGIASNAIANVIREFPPEIREVAAREFAQDCQRQIIENVNGTGHAFNAGQVEVETEIGGHA